MVFRRRSGLPFGGALLLLALFGLSLPLIPAPEAGAQGRKEKDGDKKKKKKGDKDDEGQEMEGTEISTLIRVEPTAKRHAQRGWEIEVRGTARFPDEADLTVALMYAFPENDPIEMKTHIPVSQRAFGNKEKIVFGPYPANDIAHGHYWLVARFVYDQQLPDVQKQFRSQWPDPDTWKRYVDCSDRRAVLVGTEAQEAIEDEKRREHYRRTSKMVLDLMEEFDEALVAALRETFENDAEWKADVEEKGLLRQEGDDLRKKLDELKKKAKKYTNGKKLDVDAWREFVDREESEPAETHPLKSGGLRGRLARVIHDHKEFSRSKLGGKLPKADDRIERMATGLYDLTMKWSRNLYVRYGIDRDPADLSPQDPVRIREAGSHKKILSLARAVEQEMAVRMPEG